MDLLDSLRKLARGDEVKTVPIEFASGERKMYRVVAGVRPGALRSVVGDLVLTDTRVVFTPRDTKDIAAVEIGSGPTLVRPPTLILVGTDGSRHEFGILSSRFSLNRSAADSARRDDVVRRVRSLIEGRLS